MSIWSRVQCSNKDNYFTQWLGNGSHEGRWLVVGIEEGEDKEYPSGNHRIDYWCSVGMPQLTDARDKQIFCILNNAVLDDIFGDSGPPVWRKMAYNSWHLRMINSVETNNPSNNKTILLPIMRDRWGRSDYPPLNQSKITESTLNKITLLDALST